jgi:hypothetical protein
MNKRIAIEPKLTPVKELLTNKGYTVDSINFGEFTNKSTDKYDAYIITGMDKNFLGVNDTSTRAVVIDATGLTAEQVYHELQMRLD